MRPPDIWLQPAVADQDAAPSALRRLSCGSRRSSCAATGSPAIDSGLGIDVLVDLAGVTRPQGSRPDRGAFEFVPAAPGLHQVWLPLIGR